MAARRRGARQPSPSLARHPRKTTATGAPRRFQRCDQHGLVITGETGCSLCDGARRRTSRRVAGLGVLLALLLGVGLGSTAWLRRRPEEARAVFSANSPRPAVTPLIVGAATIAAARVDSPPRTEPNAVDIPLSAEDSLLGRATSIPASATAGSLQHPPPPPSPAPPDPEEPTRPDDPTDFDVERPVFRGK
jgi:hypothetical protein